MSKSKRNVVDPEHIIQTYGADTARLFMLSDSPPERDLEWTETGIEGAHRFIQKIWKLATVTTPCREGFTLDKVSAASKADEMLALALNKAIDDIANDIERFAFNRCIAHLHILVSALTDYQASEQRREDVFGFVMGRFAVLLSMFSPHIAEEIWARSGRTGLVSQAKWPEIDAHWLIADTAEIAIQINGKLRARLELPLDCPASEAEEKALALESLQRYLEGKTLKRVIVVPNRIINVVC